MIGSSQDLNMKHKVEKTTMVMKKASSGDSPLQ
jgi:hypothetical protein